MRSLSAPLTEDRLIADIAQALGEPPRALRVGIGDDAAAWKPARSHLSLVTTDALVDGVHFRLEQTTPEMLGHKALAVNLSDIAAMGGRPVLAVVALGMTDAVDETWVLRFYRGMNVLARASHCAIAGGDIARMPVLTIVVTVVGDVRPSNMRLRSGAKAGDLACVSGPLGLAAAYLRAPSDAGELRQAYETPAPRLAEGRFLGAARAVHAMMDISDGLSLDASRMARASRLDVCLDLSAIRAHRPRALEQRADALELMLHGGDDYELLAAVEPRAYANLAKRYRARFGRELWVAGTFEAGEGKAWTIDGKERKAHEPRGYDHVAQRA